MLGILGNFVAAPGIFAAVAPHPRTFGLLTKVLAKFFGFLNEKLRLVVHSRYPPPAHLQSGRLASDVASFA
jgi:hypothetical protein